MGHFFSHLFSTDFMPHRFCLRLPDLIWLHAASDSAIALSYFLIPISLVNLVRRRANLVYPWMFLLFGLFILSCGTTHLLAVWTLWTPIYRFDGLVKALTAISSLLTAVLLIRLSPSILAIPSPAQLRLVNAQLSDEIAERRRAEAEVRELNVKLQERVTTTERDMQFIMDLLPALVCYIDKDGYYQRLNRTYQEWFQRPAETIQGHHIGEILGPRFLDQIQPYLNAVLSGQNVRFEANHEYPSGARTVDVTYAPDRDRDGSVRGFASLIFDVSDRKRAEQELQRRTDLLQQSMEPLVIWELDRCIEYWNQAAAELYGYTASEAIGQRNHRLLRTSFLSGSEADFDERLRAEGSWEGELKHCTRDGREITVASRIRLVTEANGKRMVLESNRDITARKRMETDLRQLNETLEARVSERTRQLTEINQELEAFSYSVSHDLRAPLRSVDGFARILLRDYQGALEERGIHYLERMSAATVRMGQLIEDMLNLAQVSRAKPRKEPADLSALVETAWAEISARNSSRFVKLTVQPGVKGMADPRLLRIVLENLLGNAWKFTGKTPRPEVSFGYHREAGTPVFFVRDNGAGFNMAHRDQLFAPFQRLHPTKDFEGTGIGLAIVQRIIRRHGGKVWAEAKSGDGAAFFFTLGAEENGEQADSAG